jgi:hypothetical protein
MMEDASAPLGDAELDAGGGSEAVVGASSMPQAAEAAASVELSDGPHPDLAEAVDAQLASTDMIVADTRSDLERFVAMDAHDVALLLGDLLEQTQTKALRRWVYDLPGGGGRGLTVHGVQDITQRMNWTGRCSIGIVKGSLRVTMLKGDEGNGPEDFWIADVEAEDAKTGQVQLGSSMEPQMMRLRPETAKKKRAAGAVIGEDNRVFDRFARTKAIAKATRNAQAAFIPEEVEQAVIAMAAKRPELVERIQSEGEAKAAEMPPALATDEAKELIARCESIYAAIRDLGSGRGKIKLTPGQFNAWMLNSHHDMGALERFKAYLETRAEEIPAEFAREDLWREATEKAREVACPVDGCGAERFKACKTRGGAHPERVQLRAEQLGAAS